MTTTPPASWPNGVIGRCRTVGGATVDLTYETQTGVIRAVCGGELCHWTGHTSTEGRLNDTPEKEKARFDEWLPIARRRAQEHVDACSWLPRPA